MIVRNNLQNTHLGTQEQGWREGKTALPWSQLHSDWHLKKNNNSGTSVWWWQHSFAQTQQAFSQRWQNIFFASHTCASSHKSWLHCVTKWSQNVTKWSHWSSDFVWIKYHTSPFYYLIFTPTFTLFWFVYSISYQCLNAVIYCNFCSLPACSVNC